MGMWKMTYFFKVGIVPNQEMPAYVLWTGFNYTSMLGNIN